MASILFVVASMAPAMAAEVDSMPEPKGGDEVVRVEFTGPSLGAAEGEGIVPMAAGTWKYTVYVSKTYAGIKDYTWAHRVNWTGDGSNITAHSYTHFSAYSGWLVSYLGRISHDSFSYWSGGKKHYDDFQQGKYSHGPCPACWYTHPYAETVVRGDGAKWIVDWGT